MPRQHLASLFVCSVISLTVGNIITGLIPIYITQLGGDPGVVGAYFSVQFLALVVGTVAAGWLSARFQRRKTLLILSGIPVIPLTWLSSQVTDVGQLALLQGISTVFAGMGIALVNILAGLFAPEGERGKVFGILASAGAIGGLIGGFASGPIADRWGYPGLLQALALWGILYPLAASFAKDKVVEQAAGARARITGLGKGFYALFVANVIAWVTLFMSGLGRPLVMDTLGFDATAVSSTIAVGAAVTLPLPAVLGWLSDRMGRKWLIALCYAVGGLGLFALAVSSSVWHFWLSTILVSSIPVSLGICQALAVDLIPRESISTGVALFSSTNLIAGIIGFAITGQIINALGMTPTFVAGAFLPLIAILLLGFVRQPAREAVAT